MRLKNLLKAGLASLIALSGCGRSKMDPFLTKLPDGNVRIEYEKLIDKPFERFMTYSEFNYNQREEKAIDDALFWMPSNSRYLDRRDRYLEGNFFQKTNFNDKVKMGPKINPKDGIPEAFIVPVYKGELLNGESIDSRKGKHLFFLYLFFDKDYIDKAGSMKLYFAYPAEAGTFLGSIGKLKLQKSKGIFFTTLDTSKENMQGGDRYSKYPVYLIGDLKPQGKKSDDGELTLESSNLNKPLCTVFGMYDPDIKRRLNPLDDAKTSENKKGGIEEIISECFDPAFQTKLEIAHEKAIQENPGQQLFMLSIGQYKNCVYKGFRGRYPVSDINGEASLSIFDTEKKLEVRLKVRYNGKSWDIKEKEDLEK